MKMFVTDHAEFPDTRWTWVVQAGRSGDAPLALRAMESLCEAYWRPVYAFLRHQGHSKHDSEDLTQGFFSAILASPLFENATPELGRFRTYLLGALRNFVAKEFRKGGAAKRGGGRCPLSLDLANAESGLAAALLHAESPDQVFDRRWALDLLEVTFGRLERRYRDSKQGAFFDAAKDRLLCAPDVGTVADAARRLGMEEGAFKVALHRMRKRFNNALREEVARTLDDEGEIEQELRYLVSLFATS